jgi:hypothetical protein
MPPVSATPLSSHPRSTCSRMLFALATNSSLLFVERPLWGADCVELGFRYWTGSVVYLTFNVKRYTVLTW